jgi:hypothetical protein
MTVLHTMVDRFQLMLSLLNSLPSSRQVAAKHGTLIPSHLTFAYYEFMTVLSEQALGTSDIPVAAVSVVVKMTLTEKSQHHYLVLLILVVVVLKDETQRNNAIILSTSNTSYWPYIRVC